MEANTGAESCSWPRSCGSDAGSSAVYGNDVRNHVRPRGSKTMVQASSKAKNLAGRGDHSASTGSCAEPRTTAATVGRGRTWGQSTNGSYPVQMMWWLLPSLVLCPPIPLPYLAAAYRASTLSVHQEFQQITLPCFRGFMSPPIPPPRFSDISAPLGESPKSVEKPLFFVNGPDLQI